MKININQIIEGWRNEILPPKKRKEIINAIGRERMKICNVCEHNSKFHKTMRMDVHCIECGCTLRAKTKCLSCDCPLKEPKWKMLLTENEEEEFINGIQA